MFFRSIFLAIRDVMVATSEAGIGRVWGVGGMNSNDSRRVGGLNKRLGDMGRVLEMKKSLHIFKPFPN